MKVLEIADYHISHILASNDVVVMFASDLLMDWAISNGELSPALAEDMRFLREDLPKLPQEQQELRHAEIMERFRDQHAEEWEMLRERFVAREEMEKSGQPIPEPQEGDFVKLRFAEQGEVTGSRLYSMLLPLGQFAMEFRDMPQEGLEIMRTSASIWICCMQGDDVVFSVPAKV